MSSFLLSIDEILNATGGQLVLKQDTFVYGVSSDSREMKKGDLFIPLKGEKFDAHEFIFDVEEKNVGAILFSNSRFKPKKTTAIQVDDTLKALQDLASYYRHKIQTKIIAITGSNGKTTTKFFTETILNTQYKVFASKKSFNNHIGVPLTLLSITPDTDFGVVEIGMNHPGEIASLTKLADPDIEVVTTVGRAHIMDFGNIDGIAKEKADIYKAARNDSIKIFNLDNPWTKKMSREMDCHFTFSVSDSDADVSFQIQKISLESMTISGRIFDSENEVEVPIFGKHNVVNLMAASCLALACGMSPEKIWNALPQCRTVWGRNMIVDLKDNSKMIFDGYNANPDSMQALIENMGDLEPKGLKIAILGDMLELGDLTKKAHMELGEQVGRSGFDLILFSGKNGDPFKTGVERSGFKNKLIISNGYEEDVAKGIASMLKPSSIIILKGSRGARLEKYVPHFDPINWKANV